MVNKNIQMKNKNGETWDNLFPLTKSSNVYSDQGKKVSEDIDDLKDSPYYDEITYTEHYDSVSKTHYYLTYIPNLDKDGLPIELKHAYPNNNFNSSGIAREKSVEENASFVCNASRWNTSTNKISGIQIKDGIILQDTIYSDNYTLGIKENNKLVAYPPSVTAQTILMDGCRNALTGFYPFIENGKQVDESIYQASSEPNERNPRQAIAQMSNNDIIILTCDGRNNESQGFTYADMIRILLGRGVIFAYNLDGGGSVQTVNRGVLINNLSDDYGTEERQVKDFLYVGNPDPLNKLDMLNRDLGYLSAKLSKVYGHVNSIKKNLFDRGYIKINSDTDFKAEGIVLQENGIDDRKLYLRKGDIGYYDLETNAYMFQVHKTGELQTSKGQIAEFYSNLKVTEVSNLNSITNSGFYWGNSEGTQNLPNTNSSWAVLHLYYDGLNKMQIAYPYSQNSTQNTMMRRTNNGVWETWREL